MTFARSIGALLLLLSCAAGVAACAPKESSDRMDSPSTTCPVGSEGCPCTDGGGCDSGLSCLSDVCVELPSSNDEMSEPTSGAAGSGASTNVGGGSNSKPGGQQPASQDPEPPTLEELCRRRCEKADTCDDKVDVLDCTENCTKNTGARLEATEFYTLCVEEASCSEISSGEFLDCLDDRVKALPLSDQGATACSSVAAKAELCNGDYFDEEAVLRNCERLPARLFSDELLLDVATCFEESACNAIENCVWEAGDRFNNNIDMAVLLGGEEAARAIKGSAASGSESSGCVADFESGCSSDSDCCSSGFTCYEGYCFSEESS